MCYETAIVCNLNKYHWIEIQIFACFVSLFAIIF